jgi:hypothetical protein
MRAFNAPRVIKLLQFRGQPQVCAVATGCRLYQTQLAGSRPAKESGDDDPALHRDRRAQEAVEMPRVGGIDSPAAISVCDKELVERRKEQGRGTGARAGSLITGGPKVLFVH